MMFILCVLVVLYLLNLRCCCIEDHEFVVVWWPSIGSPAVDESLETLIISNIVKVTLEHHDVIPSLFVIDFLGVLGSTPVGCQHATGNAMHGVKVVNQIGEGDGGGIDALSPKGPVLRDLKGGVVRIQDAQSPIVAPNVGIGVDFVVIGQIVRAGPNVKDQETVIAGSLNVAAVNDGSGGVHGGGVLRYTRVVWMNRRNGRQFDRISTQGRSRLAFILDRFQRKQGKVTVDGILSKVKTFQSGIFVGLGNCCSQ